MLKFKYNGGWEVGGYRSFYYLATHPSSTESNRLVGCQGMNSCREYFVKNLRRTITSNDSFVRSARKAYVLVTFGRCYRTNFVDEKANLDLMAEKSLYIINSFEKEHKWQRTKAHAVECENMALPLVFFNGPRRWTMSPYLMSIWAQMIRLGTNSWLPKKLMKLSHEDLVRQLAIAAKSSVGTDAAQLSDTIREWDNFMFLYKEMFGSANRKYHWRRSHLHGGNDRPEGIQKLLNGTTYYKSLHQKYYKLKEANKLK